MKTKRKNKLMDGCVIAALAAAVAAPAFCAEWPVCRTFDGELVWDVPRERKANAQ